MCSMATGSSAIEVPKEASRLCWSARIVCLAPWIAAPLLGLVVEAAFHTMYETRFPFNLPLAMLGWFGYFLVFPGFVLTIPTLIAWRRHLLGGTLLVLSSGLFISWISVSGRGITPLSIPELAVCVVFLLGGILHLVVWWKEGAQKISWLPT